MIDPTTAAAAAAAITGQSSSTATGGTGGGGGFPGKVVLDLLLAFVRNNFVGSSNPASALKPWREFASVNKFGKPGQGLWVSRMLANIGYFRSNYLAVFILFLIYSVFTSPGLLLSIAVIGSGWSLDSSLQGKPITLFGREITSNERKLILGLLTLLIFLFSSAGSTLFWAVGVSTIAIVAHASFYDSSAISGPETKADPELGGFDAPFTVQPPQTQ